MSRGSLSKPTDQEKVLEKKFRKSSFAIHYYNYYFFFFKLNTPVPSNATEERILSFAKDILQPEQEGIQVLVL